MVVLRLHNAGPLRAHSLSTRYWMDIPLTVRGEAREGTSEGRTCAASSPPADRGQTGAFFVLPPTSP